MKISVFAESGRIIPYRETASIRKTMKKGD